MSGVSREVITLPNLQRVHMFLYFALKISTSSVIVQLYGRSTTTFLVHSHCSVAKKKNSKLTVHICSAPKEKSEYWTVTYQRQNVSIAPKWPKVCYCNKTRGVRVLEPT